MGIDRRDMMRLALAAGAASTLGGRALAKGGQEVIPLWPGRPPGAPATLPKYEQATRGTPERPRLWVTGVDRPTIAVYRPARANGFALLMIPGGGYGGLAFEQEGLEPSRHYAAMGYTVFLLTYRLPKQGWAKQADVPLQDAQRALRLIRAGATRFGVDPAKIGVMGFSAGGHLAASLATGYGEAVYAPVDAADRVSARPDFAAPIYAVTTLEGPGAHSGSRRNLLADPANEAEVQRRSPLFHIDAKTPPSFVAHAVDDRTVPVAASLRWIEACVTAQVPVEGHILQRGGHGFGVSFADDMPGGLWPQTFDRWVKRLYS